METKRCSCGKFYNVVPGRPEKCKECATGKRTAQVRKETRQNRETPDGSLQPE